MFHWACRGNLRPPSVFDFIPVVLLGGVLTTTHGLDVAMSVSADHDPFYVVYRSLQLDRTMFILTSVPRTLHRCDSRAHMEAAPSFLATGGFRAAAVQSLPLHTRWRGKAAVPIRTALVTRPPRQHGSVGAANYNVLWTFFLQHSQSAGITSNSEIRY